MTVASGVPSEMQAELVGERVKENHASAAGNSFSRSSTSALVSEKEGIVSQARMSAPAERRAEMRPRWTGGVD